MSKRIPIITAIIVAVIAVGATATYITLEQGGEEVRRQGEGATTSEEPVVQAKQPSVTEPTDTPDWKAYSKFCKPVDILATNGRSLSYIESSIGFGLPRGSLPV